MIDELFEKLTIDDDSSAQVLEEYTDYRTYMDYDIKISIFRGDGAAAGMRAAFAGISVPGRMWL